MRSEVIVDVGELASIESDWNDLLADSRINHLGLSPKWARAWWKTFASSECKPEVHSWWHGEQLMAVASLIHQNVHMRGIPVAQLASMSNGHTPLWDIVLRNTASDDHVSQVLQDLAESTSANVLALKRVPVESAVASFAENGRLSGLRAGTKDSFPTPIIDTSEDWETYFSQRPKKFRQNIRKKLRDFDKQDGASVEARFLEDRNDPLFAQLVELSGRSWKAAEGKDLASNSSRREFLANLVTEFGPDKGIRIHTASIGDRIASFEFHVEYAGTTYPIRADYDDELRKLAPGSVIDYFAIRHSFESPEISVYDSCANQYWYLKNWTDQYRHQKEIRFYKTGLRGTMLYQLEHKLVPYAKRVIRKKDAA